MSWRGDGYPVLIVDGTATSFPYPLLGSRREEWVEESSEIATRRNGSRVHLDRELRFEAEYTFINLSQAQVEALIGWYNAWPRTTVTVRPRHDVTVLQVACWIEEPPEIVSGVKGSTDSVRVLLRAINTVQSIPIPDDSVAASAGTLLVVV